DTGIDAFIGIGMGATDYQQPMQHPFSFAGLKIPILDLYGEDDYPAVQRMAPERLTLIEEGGNRASSQRIAPGADHYFIGQADLLLQEVGAWLGSLGY
ncbi:MAG: hypothetical protein QGG10_07125, partial [Arenicellales bacterium]|nr:hypothetical protein [Arenicellales bacterium]